MLLLLGLLQCSPLIMFISIMKTCFCCLCWLCYSDHAHLMSDSFLLLLLVLFQYFYPSPLKYERLLLFYCWCCYSDHAHLSYDLLLFLFLLVWHMLTSCLIASCCCCWYCFCDPSHLKSDRLLLLLLVLFL